MKICGMHEKELFESSFPFRILFNHEINFQYPPHWHNAIELLYVENNDFTVFVNSKEILLHEKDIIFIPGGDIHEFRCETPTGVRIFINFEISNLSFVENIHSLISNVRIIKPEEEELYYAIKNEIDKIRKEYQSAGVTSPLFYIARMIDILVLLCKNTPVQIHTDNIANNKRKVLGLEKINRTFEYIEENYHKDIRLGDIANAVGFSEYYFSRIFKENTEKSFHQYLNEYRIKKVEPLLGRADVSISQAAREVGFTSIATFDRLFKQIKGCTPQEYRKLRI